METRTGRFVFVEGTGERVLKSAFVFAQPVVNAWVALQGYDAEYVGGDHHLQTLTVELAVAPPKRIDEGYEVDVVATFDLRDDNGDDNFAGSIDFVLFVEFQGLFASLLSSLVALFRGP
jgi:hypothetical protein